MGPRHATEWAPSTLGPAIYNRPPLIPRSSPARPGRRPNSAVLSSIVARAAHNQLELTADSTCDTHKTN